MTSRVAYVASGAGIGFFYGLFGLGTEDSAASALLSVGITTASGGILGAALHATRSWAEHGPAANLLRWILGLGLAGLILGLAASAVQEIPVGGVPAAVAAGLLLGLGFGFEDQRGHLFSPRTSERTPRDVAQLWFVILGTIAVGCGLFGVSWYFTR